MNRLQQQIKDFHEMLIPVLRKVLEEYGKLPTPKRYNTVAKPCKQLIQKCSCKSVSDISSLSSLAYWLYIFEYKALALEICELAHDVDFPAEYGADHIANMCGLEIRIARELFGENRRGGIPPGLLEYYFSKRVKRAVAYPKILREEEITSCNGRWMETELLYALCNMIGKGETGLYKDLNDNRDKMEEAIIEYIGYLKEEISLCIMTRELCHELFKGWENDPAIYMDMDLFTTYEYDEAAVNRYFESKQEPSRVLFAVMLDGRPIGELQLKRIDRENKECTLSIHMQNDRVKGHGYGTRAERLALQYAFDVMGMAAVNADAVAKNTRSQHVLEKAGFRYISEEGGVRYYQCVR